MIISKNIKLEIHPPFDSGDVERELFARNIKPIRWAVVYVAEQNIVVNVSYVKES